MLEMTPESNKPLALVVEDVSFIADVLAAELTKVGFLVFVIAHGQEAIDYLNNTLIAPRLVILDLALPPGPQGIHVLDYIKSNSKKLEFPYIILETAYDDLAAKIVAQANVVLIKPFDIQHLVEKAREAYRGC